MTHITKNTRIKNADLKNKSKVELARELKEADEDIKRREADDRQRDAEEMLQQGGDVSAVVIMPRYVKDKRLNIDKEAKPVPSPNLYIPLGWDEDSETKRKHYRKYYKNELEENKDIFGENPSPFNSYPLIRGQARGNSGDGMFSSAKKDASGQADTCLL